VAACAFGNTSSIGLPLKRIELDLGGILLAEFRFLEFDVNALGSARLCSMQRRDARMSTDTGTEKIFATSTSTPSGRESTFGVLGLHVR
jgi:hypothetical protein